MSDVEGLDFHVHVGRPEQFNEQIHDLMERFNPEVYETFVDEGEIPERAVEAALDEAGLEYAVVLAHETPRVDIDVPNEYVLRYADRSERLIPFASINPNTQFRPVRRLRELVDAGMRGLKLYPSYQYFSPNENHVYPLYAAAADLDVPVMFHVGSSVFEGSRTKYATPLPIEDVLVDFPDLTVVMAHGGRPAWYEQAEDLVRRHDNLYLELSGIPPHRLTSKYFPEIGRFEDSVIFGTDYPTTPSTAENLDAIASQDVSDDFVEKITVDNPQRILGR
ncbi:MULTISPECIES: amidohydrolase family protein [Halorussus]|uniref:amidohydrolase family protein n=1 Tax=Halorussus TaxID=1070314 RepID=UPI00209DB61D|nr:amidohydrolase family protein [Halorussus vallis]USZ77872.1 amidohydrolase family protein [Halorussus vallis]